MSVRVALSVRDRSLSRRGAAPPLHSRRSGPDRRMPPGGGDWRRVPAGIPSASRHDAARRADVSSAEPTPDSEADGAIPCPHGFIAYSVLKLIVNGRALPIGFGTMPSKSGLDTENWVGLTSQMFV